MLDNITVVQADLEAVKPNISLIIDGSAANIDDMILEARRVVYSIVKRDYVKNNPLYNDTEVVANLAKVKDYDDVESIKSMIVDLAISEIYKSNANYEDYEVWRDSGIGKSLTYYIDADDDSIADPSEEEVTPTLPSFGR